MAEEHRTVSRQEEKTDSGRPQELRQSVLTNGVAGMSEVESLFRAVERKFAVEPTVEVWTRFNEHLMGRIAESAQRHPTAQERRQELFDRLSASDSVLKERLWVVGGVVVLAVSIALAYLLIRTD